MKSILKAALAAGSFAIAVSTLPAQSAPVSGMPAARGEASIPEAASYRQRHHGGYDYEGGYHHRPNLDGFRYGSPRQHYESWGAGYRNHGYSDWRSRHHDDVGGRRHHEPRHHERRHHN
ncbi:MAG: hypothetical protein J0I57_04525 [Hyphomicrobium sp.]|nr:hypothetical protein [Hyphomicrobium sp.]MBN9276882.1 hypothetical protein [Hyphomicrobium sp.]